LNILCIPLACTCSSMPMILGFVVLMESMSSSVFLSQLLCCLTKGSSVFFLWFLFYHLHDFCLIHFSEVFPYLCSIPLLYRVVLSSLFHISLFYIVLCFTLVFIEVLSKFIYLFLSTLMLFFVVSWNFLSTSYTFWLTMSIPSPWISQ
jgi:hypothetical protein